MTREDIARVALGAPALHEVFIVSTPDCLPVKSWARVKRSQPEEASVHLGNLVRTARDTLAAVGAAKTPLSITVEAEDGLVLLTRLSDELVAGFVFDRSAPLGLVRVQARQLTDQLRATLVSPRTDAPQRPETSAPTRIPEATSRAAPGPANPAGPNARGERPEQGRPATAWPEPANPGRPDPWGERGESRSTAPRGERGSTAVGPEHASSGKAGERSAQDSSATWQGEWERGTAADPAARSRLLPGPNPADHGTTQARSEHQAAPPPPGAEDLASVLASVETATSARASARPRAVRLLEFFRRYAPDPHAALLRLSLRTSIPVERLEAPESLDEAQVESLAVAVRDILGQEQMSL